MRSLIELRAAVAVLGVFAVSTPALPGDALSVADARCVIVGMQTSSTGDSAQLSRGVAMTMYFMGRLDGRVSTNEIQRLLIDEARKFTASDFASEEQRCVAKLTQMGHQITRIGLEMGKVAR